MAEFNSILTAIEKAVEKFNKNIPAAQRSMFDGIEEELRRLDTKDGKIKASVRNLKVIASIKNKLLRLVLTDDYKKQVKEFAKSFNEITTLQNEYWKGLESTFKPRPLLREIRKAAISDTVKALTEGGISANITTAISDILKTNITGGGSYKALTAQLRESLLNTKTDGLLSKYAKTITVDALSTYSRTYNDTVSSDLGFEWFAYSGTEIRSSRELCQALIENHRYFHLSSIPNILKGLDEQGNPLKFTDNVTKDVKSVRVNPRNDLPYGLKDGTNVSNFRIRAGGWNCPHVCRPVPERNVKTQDPALYQSIINSPPYKSWVNKNDPEKAAIEPEIKKGKGNVIIKGTGEAAETQYKEFAKREIEALGINQDVEINIKGALRHYADGEVNWGKPDSDGKFFLTPKINLRDKDIDYNLKTIKHELRHIQQSESGRFYFKKGGYFWDGKPHTSLGVYRAILKGMSQNKSKEVYEKAKKRYKALPWEFDADEYAGT